MKISSGQRSLRWAALLLAVLSALPAQARAHHSEAWARDRFAAAERMREALNGRPAADRTRDDYQRVLIAYRSVYFGAPASAKADPSVVAVAETLVEMGRRFDDDKILKEAISQYRFLRREYPGSKYRYDALFTIGEIYKDDLNQPVPARAAFRDFLRRYPHNRLSADAQQAIADLNHQDSAAKSAEAKTAAAKADEKKTDGKPVAEKGNGEKENSGKDQKNAKGPAEADGASRAAHAQGTAVEVTPARLPRVTRIRHWSTPDYTRVAIDLEGDVKFASQRIAHPDRIFFDLRDTKLASTLVGKSFDVDDGFLKKIRVAQFQPGLTRVVLEVDDLSDYDAFLLPNPYRLVIDIHGKDAHGGQTRDKPKDKQAGEVATAADGAAGRQAGSGISKAGDAGLKPEPQARGKVPVTSLDVGDATRIVPKEVPEPKSATAMASKSSVTAKKMSDLPVKKVVEADDDEEASPSGAARDTTKGASDLTLQPGSAGSASSKSADNVDDDSAVADMKTSATAHTVVSRSRRKPGGPAAAQKPGTTADREVREARPTASGDRSLIRALGLKIGKIVIDPGHGGHDAGTVGPNGLEEKDLVLEVGRRLGKLLETRLGAEVVYTRKDDTFIPLETRTAVANQERADLFISIHANSSRDSAARGVETYYLNFTSSAEALEVAARENAVSEKSIYELQDLVKKIALKEKIEESREFASDVQESLHSGLAVKSSAIRDRGVKKAPFIVLIGANMPSILAEISFVSNPSDERRLETSEYRQRIAESLYRGIAKYANGLSGVKVASKLDKAAAQ